MKKRNSLTYIIIISCFLLSLTILVILAAKSCKEPKPPTTPTVERTIIDTLNAKLNILVQQNSQLQTKVDSLFSIVDTLGKKQQQAKQGASNAIAVKNDAKQRRDTVAQLNACDSLEKEHLAYVEYTEQKDAEVAKIIEAKDEQNNNLTQQVDNVKLQNTTLQASNKEKDEQLQQKDKATKKAERKANRNANWAKIFGGTTIIAIIITIVQILSPI